MENFADRLLAAVERSGSPACVGIDPKYASLPDAVCKGAADELAAVREFCHGVLEAVAPHVPAVKPQSAYFEVYRAAGVELYYDVVRRARELGLIVIGDVKRNDIGSTAAAYAKAHLTGDDAPDAVTVNGYFGADGIEPFADVAATEGKGLFVLVRTSNPSAPQVQDVTDAAGRKVFEHMAMRVAGFGTGPGLVGQSGFSSLGAVVGATWPEEAKALRDAMPQQIFLVPGYGAQGATAADCAAAFDAAGRGAIVNASRSVIYAHARDAYAGLDWREAVGAAAQAFARDIASALPDKRGAE